MKLRLPLLFAVALALSACATTATTAKTAAKPYPLKTCIVSGDKLDSMGKPYVFVRNGQEVKLCCEGCRDDFNKNPDKYLKEIAAKSASH